MPSEKQIDAAILSLIEGGVSLELVAAMVHGNTSWGIKPGTLARALTAAEHAKPALSTLTFDQWWDAGGSKLVLQAADKHGWKGAAEQGYIGGLLAPKPAPAALEPAEPATGAEREFNEILEGAQEFNDALPERMRRNARDWLRPDDEPATDAEAFASCSDCAGSGYSNHPDSGQVCYRCDGQGSYTRPPESRLREALESIANNTCCSGCQEAALVARAALAQEDGR